MKLILKSLIWLYRISAAALFNPCCRFLPTCSEYALEAIEIHGKSKGLWLSIKRIARCNPLAGSGFDPVPNLKMTSKSKDLKLCLKL